ncbi:MAG: hypothetical protein PUE30_04825 [Spirochaetia bacterium]|nr:hypothetical protein [Treponema berlinense]MDD5789829.1 hypothetical protein [Spirochaetia bacterium]
MIFGFVCAFLICLSSVIFSVLAVALDNLGDKCIKRMDKKELN